ncbi:MAG: ATP-binding protein [Rhodocyclaceae bacterium]
MNMLAGKTTPRTSLEPRRDVEETLALLDLVGSPMLAHRADRIIYANPAMEKLTGRQRESLYGTPVHALAHTDDVDTWHAHSAGQLCGGPVPDSQELRLVCHNGEVRHVEVRSTPMSVDGEPVIVCFVYDLTERIRAARNEHKLIHLLSQILEGDPVPTFVINADHVVTHWNRACAAVTGTPADSIVGTQLQWRPFYAQTRPVLADLIVDGRAEEASEIYYAGELRASAIVEGAYESEHFFPQFGDHGRWLHFTAAPLYDEHGNVVGAIETLVDVTDRNLADEALRAHQGGLERLIEQRTRQLEAASQQLVQSEKLASIGQLAAGVAHEINNPIGYVHSNIGSLEQYIDDLFRLLEAYEAAEPALAPPQAAALAAMRQQLDVNFLKQDIPMLVAESKEGITRVKKIVQDLKDFSHVDAHQEWQWTDLRVGLDSTLNIVNNEIKYKADVVRDYADIPEVECLPSQLNQVFMNLLVNAAHAMGDERGTITVRARQLDPQHVAIEIADDGCGIPDDVRQKIFDPFFTTKPIGKGTGLGLSLSYGIVQNHNGRIEVESTTGVGTVFRVVLPIRRPQPMTPPDERD